MQKTQRREDHREYSQIPLGFNIAEAGVISDCTPITNENHVLMRHSERSEEFPLLKWLDSSIATLPQNDTR